MTGSDLLFEPYSSSERTSLRRRLRTWYTKHARQLPWRATGDPYRIWISEIMLQQTTVATVIPYYERFMERFATVHRLAEAEQDEVLRLWEGLGYYSRARNIHKTARELVTSTDGEFPRTIDELSKLPGIGRYTAGAILSFAFDLPAPIVEANTIRLYSRLLGYEENPRSAKGQRTLWAFAEHLLPRKDVGSINQAFMELGSLVCRPTAPDCPDCPLKANCRALQTGSTDRIPVTAPRAEPTLVFEASVAVQHAGRFLLRRNPEGQRWAGLWDFVRFSIPDEVARLIPDSGLGNGAPLPTRLLTFLEKQVHEHTNLDVHIDRFLVELKHGVTRFRIRLQCLLAEAELESDCCPETDDVRWLTPDHFEDVPLSTTGRKLARRLQRDQRQKRLL